MEDVNKTQEYLLEDGFSIIRIDPKTEPSNIIEELKLDVAKLIGKVNGEMQLANEVGGATSRKEELHANAIKSLEEASMWITKFLTE